MKRGSAINDQDIERIQRLHELWSLVYRSDFNGERIRRMIMTAFNSTACASQAR